MTTKKLLSFSCFNLFIFLFLLLIGSCGGGGSDDGSSLSYSETVTAMTTAGLTTFTKGEELNETYNALYALDIDGTTDRDTEFEAAVEAYLDALEDYNDHLSTIESYENTVFSSSSSSINSAELIRFTGLQDLGGLNQMVEDAQQAQEDCEAIKAERDAINTSTSEGLLQWQVKNAEWQQCMARSLPTQANSGFNNVVVSGGGGIVGAGAGGLFYIYASNAGLAIATGGASLFVTVGIILGGVTASAIYSACTSDSDPDVSGKFLSPTSSCGIGSVQGTTGTSMPMNLLDGTGDLLIFIDGCAPIKVEDVGFTAGQRTTVNVDCVDLSDVTDDSSSDIIATGDDASVSESTETASTCSEIISLSAANSPADPSPSDNVTVTATLFPAVSGCSISYSVAGTDGYADSATYISNSSGQISFVIPAADEEGVIDVVSVSESASGLSYDLSYVF